MLCQWSNPGQQIAMHACKHPAPGCPGSDAPKSTCRAARKFADFLARRMTPMIQHAARDKVPEPADDSEVRRLQ
jgi:hypothetical protein